MWGLFDRSRTHVLHVFVHPFLQRRPIWCREAVLILKWVLRRAFMCRPDRLKNTSHLDRRWRIPTCISPTLPSAKYCRPIVWPAALVADGVFIFLCSIDFLWSKIHVYIFCKIPLKVGLLLWTLESGVDKRLNPALISINIGGFIYFAIFMTTGWLACSTPS